MSANLTESPAIARNDADDVGDTWRRQSARKHYKTDYACQ